MFILFNLLVALVYGDGQYAGRVNAFGALFFVNHGHRNLSGKEEPKKPQCFKRDG